MNINKNYKIGLRAIKTAIAVSICMMMTYITKRDEAFIAAFAAIICMQPTYNQTFKSGLNRLFGTISGGIIGYALLELSNAIPSYKPWWNVILAPLCLLIVIYICNMFDKQPSVSIACIVLLCCIAQPVYDVNDPLIYVVNRVLSTSFGVVVAMVVNRFLWPQKTKQEHENAINNIVKNSQLQNNNDKKLEKEGIDNSNKIEQSEKILKNNTDENKGVEQKQENCDNLNKS